MFLIGDIGGTRIKYCFGKSLRRIDNFLYFKTPSDYQEFVDFIKRIKINDLKIACFGFPGVFDKYKEKLIYSPNLRSYQFKNIKKDLEKILGCKIILENDAALAGLGEANFGVGRNYRIISYITFSTGIGGTKIINREISPNFFGFEPGHSFFLISNKKNILPFQIEELLGGANLYKIFKKDLSEVKDRNFWKDISKLVSLFLVNVSLFWSPEVIIIGGGLSRRLSIRDLRENFNKFYPFNLKPKIKKSKFLDKAGLYGGLFMIKKYLKL